MRVITQNECVASAVDPPESTPDTITIVLADDHQVVRSGLRMPLDADGLWDREAEVLQLLALGHTNSEIAEQLIVRYALDNGVVH